MHHQDTPVGRIFLQAMATVIAAGVPGIGVGDDGEAYFESSVRPIFVQHCYECHAADADVVQGDLRLDVPSGWLKGGTLGAAIVPTQPNESLLLKAIRYESEDLQMPPGGKLPEAQITIIAEWIARGAPAPRSVKPETPMTETIAERIRAGRKHWSLRPLPSEIPVPQIADGWVATPIDAFVLRRLHGAGLTPARPATKNVLIRRVWFDLVGLPPTAADVEEFLADNSPDSYARLIERLLASPHYGERWGRYWLDLARYADTNGADENKAYGNAWRYRDYVIRSLNSDKPYDRFVLEQIAGDLLPFDTDLPGKRNDNLTATGFLVLGPKMLAEQDKEKLVMDVVDEQIDLVGQTFLGLTLGCSRCHDHKFDPISADDYYALAGIFKSTSTMADLEHVSSWRERELTTPELQAAVAQFEQEVQPLIEQQTGRIDQLIATASKQLKQSGEGVPDDEKKREDRFPEATQRELKRLRATLAELKARQPTVPTAMAVADGEVLDVPVHLRGSHLNLADAPTQRDVPQAFTGIVPEPDIPADTSGRLELAHWIVDPQHPLTARVMVNRIWQGHFGFGLVRTPSNFGLHGEPPSHPELLDWLACEFIKSGWSIKHMHRLILHSSAYRMSVADDDHASQVDPQNRLLWRQNRRRLEAEPLRDALLAVSGELNRTMGGSLLQSPNNEYSRESSDDDIFDATRRAIYLPVLRNKNYEMFSIFDYSNPAVHVARRSETTVAQQALFLMNSPFVGARARRLAEKIGQQPVTDRKRIDEIALRLYSRPARPAEVHAAMWFLNSHPDGQSADAAPDDNRLRAWTDLIHALLARNEFVYVD